MAEEKRKPGRPPGSKNKKTGTQGKASVKNEKSGNKGSAGKTAAGRSRVKDEIWAIIIMAVGAFLVVAIQTEAAGAFGNILHDFFFGCFGMLAYVLPYYLILYGILLFLNKTTHISGKSAIFLLIIFLMFTLLNSVRYIDPEGFRLSAETMKVIFDSGVANTNGGFFGMVAGTLIVKAIGKYGLIIFAVVTIAIFLLLVLNTPLSQFMEGWKIRRDEKKKEREAAYAEAEKLVAMEEEKKKSSKEEELPQTLGARKGAPLIRESKPDTLTREKTGGKEMDIPVFDTEYVPGRMTEGQINIMNYMKNDELFAGNQEDLDEDGVSYGLVESSGPPAGFGLEPSSDSDESHGLGKENLKNVTPAKEMEKKLSNSQAAQAMLSAEELKLSQEIQKKPYKFPPVELLNRGKGNERPGVDGNLKAKAVKLEETLKNFHVDARVVQVTQGPAVTRYEIQPAVGVKVSSIVRLSDDIALNLEARNIRIEAPIPGKAAVGIEVENERVNMVTLREIVTSREFKEAKSRITFAVGRDIGGTAIVGDLKSMPHLLIAGSTGSGKSVCINSIILSIIYKAKPDEVKFVLVDPKVVELGGYNGIPHLLIPVVTEPSKAAAALNWAVAEMTDRYKKFAEEGVRDLESFNSTVKKKGEEDRAMTQIVIIIDELADLMMAAPSQVEESICRLAQMARAAGMHLIVATQRPSVDVVTGVIKANIPSRIAFAVSSQVDSRTILDMGGAEKLAGKGDMLYNPLGLGKPIRVQGAFVSDDEVRKVIEFLKAQGMETTYANEVINSIEKGSSTASGDDGDELLADAIETVVQSGQASVSMLQRRFRIGYNRAARIVDMMEARGIIGPADGSRPRQVLLSEVELYAMKNEGTEIEED